MKNSSAEVNYQSGKSTITIVVIVLVVGALGFWYFSNQSNKSATQSNTVEEYNPQLNPVDFTTDITNKFFSVAPGRKLVYEAKTSEGIERIEITIEKEKKNVGGFETLVYRDRVYKGNVLVEDTRDYLAQQKSTGDVWYFGEEVDNYENGKLKDHHGTFLHGTDGAKAGIWIKAQQTVGDSYHQEFYKGTAEDMLDVVAVDQTVKTKNATYTGCVKLYAWTPLDDKSKESKYNCPGVAAEVLVEHLTENKRTELISSTQ